MPVETRSATKGQKVELVLLDIEGTICPIDFVQNTLFPYAIDALPEVLRTKWNDPDFAEHKNAFPEDAKKSPEAFEAHAKELTERDVKIAYLKNLQGYLWESGYKSRAYTTPLFTDVMPTLSAWLARNPPILSAIYSSGSVFAQQLLFQHVAEPEASNLKNSFDYRDLITGWFDTANAGPKTEVASYERIAEALGRDLGAVLFLSDSVREVKAARGAGMQVGVIVRPGNEAVSHEDSKEFEVYESLYDVEI